MEKKQEYLLTFDKFVCEYNQRGVPSNVESYMDSLDNDVDEDFEEE